MNTRKRPHINHVIGIHHHVFVVFDHDYRVARVAQLLQRMNQPEVIAVVQPDAWFVENIKYINQLRANLGCQPDALRFASRQCARSAVERQIIQPDIFQKTNPVADFFDHFHCYFSLAVGQAIFQIRKPNTEFGDVELRQLRNILVVDPEKERFFFEAMTVTFGAGSFAYELVGPFLRFLRRIVVFLRINVFDHTLVGHQVIHRNAKWRIFKLNPFVGSEKNGIQSIFRNIFDRCFQVKAEHIAQRLDLPENKRVFMCPKWSNSAILNAFGIIRNNFLQIDFADHAQPVAFGASSLWRVERKIMRRRLVVRNAGGWTHQLSAVIFGHLAVVIENHANTVSVFHGNLQRVTKSFIARLVNQQTVDHNFDEVIFIAIHPHRSF